jgi:hypothetical protein
MRTSQLTDTAVEYMKTIPRPSNVPDKSQGTDDGESSDEGDASDDVGNITIPIVRGLDAQRIHHFRIRHSITCFEGDRHFEVLSHESRGERVEYKGMI